jgi:hypothetical protein
LKDELIDFCEIVVHWARWVGLLGNC